MNQALFLINRRSTMQLLSDMPWNEMKQRFAEYLMSRHQDLESKVRDRVTFVQMNRMDAITELDHRECLGVLDDRFSDLETAFIRGALDGDDDLPYYIWIPPNAYYSTPRRLSYEDVVDIVFFETAHEITKAIDDAILHDREIKPLIDKYTKLWFMSYRIRYPFERDQHIETHNGYRFQQDVNRIRRQRCVTIYDRVRTEVSIASGTNKGDLEYKDTDGYHAVRNIDEWSKDEIQATRFRLGGHGVHITVRW